LGWRILSAIPIPFNLQLNLVSMKSFALSLVFISSAALLPAQSGSASAAQQVQVHEQRAHQLLSEKKPELAIKEFAAVVALDPNNLDAQANLGVLLFFQKNYASAEPHLRAAVDQKPDLLKIRALLGMCEHRLGKTAAAETDLQAVMRGLDDANVRLQVGLELIEIYTASQDMVKAAGVVETLRKSNPADPKVLYAAYRIYSDLTNEALLSLAVDAPASGQMYQAMAHELSRQRDASGAIADYRKALAADPNLPGIHYELAEALHASDDVKLKSEAEQEYKLAVAANSTDEKAITRLGDIEAEKGDLDRSATYYTQALAFDPNDADASIGLARVYSEKGDPHSALPLLERVIMADPSNELAHYRLSSVYRALNRPDDSKREVDVYKTLRAMKEKLRQVYKDMKIGDDKAVDETK